ncbi:hypothetical protein CLCR_00342 [Cladophialophora carrionii]|uniref:Uncharacterized protein n=1 Tax=Cladophialophora carrionii TaxID=86049 RepID=A0A1C1D0M6_9EURO|nr:hypothetical protein CLCR_00342 [Cladophialophora carrionii]
MSPSACTKLYPPESYAASQFAAVHGALRRMLLAAIGAVMASSVWSDTDPTSLNGSRLREYEETEAEVLEWPVKKIAIPKTAPTTPGNLLVMERCSRAFHYALIIFWHCQGLFLDWYDKTAEEGMDSSRTSKEALVAIWRQNRDA